MAEFNKSKVSIENRYNIEEMKKQIESGYFTTTADLAEYWGIPYTTMRRVLKANGLLKLINNKKK